MGNAPCLQCIVQPLQNDGLATSVHPEILIPLASITKIKLSDKIPDKYNYSLGEFIFVAQTRFSGSVGVDKATDIIARAGGIKLSLTETFAQVRRSIYAVTVPEKLQDTHNYPAIIGTAFAVNDRCLFATNHHVITKAIELAGKDGCGAIKLLNFQDHNDNVMPVEIEVCETMEITHKIDESKPSRPLPTIDLSFFRGRVKNNPYLLLTNDTRNYQAGTRVATSGYGLGTDLLFAEGFFNQTLPAVQQGIISATLPKPSLANGLLVNMMIQGGASGSPLFLQDRPEVVGIMYASMLDTHATAHGLRNIPTNFSVAVPSNWIQKTIESFANKGDHMADSYPDFSVHLRD